MPARPTDMDPLPLVDTHRVTLPVDASRAWQALASVVGRSAMLNGRAFPVREAEPPLKLRLAGAHPFARYTLSFALDEHGGATTVSATTHARFRPGLGRLYGALVVGSGAHAIVVKRFLASLRRAV